MSEIEISELSPKKAKDDEVEREHIFYINQKDKLMEKYNEDYQNEVEDIQEKYQKETNEILEYGKKQCLLLVKKQRLECQKLEEEWKTARDNQIQNENMSNSTRSSTYAGRDEQEIE
jgi:hypothetical protein